ncbi:unnamed protein product, partial [Boreogadus saida]
VCWKDRSQKMQLSCQKGSEDETTSTLLEGTASVNSKKKRLARKRGKIRRLKQNNVWNIRRRSHTSHNIRHKEKHAVKKERYKTCHQKTMDARGVCSN